MRNRTIPTAAIILSLAGAGAPTAGAMPMGPVGLAPPSQQSPSAVYSRAAASRSVAQQERQRFVTMHDISGNQLAAGIGGVAEVASKAVASHSVAGVNAPQSGFDWGDAGLGAAGGLALSVIAAGGAFAVSGRRSRRSTALPS